MSRIDEIYARIEAADRPEVFVTLRPREEVDREHRASLAAGGRLAGVVVAVKDNVDVAGLPTTAACPGFGVVADVDAPAVAVLRAAGAVVIGKTNLDQFATGLVGTRSPYGAVRDSRRPDRISGGSSSGSAVAVALGFADIAIGTDTAGSGRIPAGLQGIVGIKPTLGVVSTVGVLPACADYDAVTILAPDLASADRAMAVLAEAAGPRPFGADIRLAAPEQPMLAVPADLPGLDRSWREAFAASVRRAEEVGFRIKHVDLEPFLTAARLLYDDALVAERYDAVGQFIDSADAERDGLDPTVARIISAANRFSAVELLATRRRLDRLRSVAMNELGDADALLVPTAPRHPTIAEVDADPVGVNSEMGVYTNFCNLFDLCGIAIPAGTVAEPDGTVSQFGITLLARAHRDAVVTDLARRLSIGPEAGPSAAWPESAGAPSVEVAVFGAHMRGGPLTHEFADRGARWSGEVRTAPAYRLVALDTVPPKPGLVRDPAVGRSISGESWTVSTTGLGDFLAHLPAPMALGQVELDDGRWVVGFGCSADVAAAGTPLDRTRW
ncbi:allophanate hydrolase [Gordonia soli]|uniref:Putative allophanate hydrolase n=1 Tax=Gordonia soli NBRC 108243 TaxID=1223545 RepID=M0QGW3_9ACTN|nr:allophanate hydrolase [Gordonia soli]GAC67850.1 putative allophanate hydrolase [Gordonia soli NBRC 108243]